MAVECVHSWQVGRCERSFTAGFNFRPVGSLCWSVCMNSIHPASSAYVDAAVILTFSVLFAVVAGPSIWQHGSMIIVWRMRGKVIRTDTCCTVLHVTVICTLAWAVLTGDDELRLAKCTLCTVYFCFFFFGICVALLVVMIWLELFVHLITPVVSTTSIIFRSKI